MNKLKQPVWKKYFVVLVITVTIFIFGLLIGSWSSSQKLEVVRSLQDQLQTQTLDFETQAELVRENPCAFGNTTKLVDELYELSLRLDFMERVLGADDKRVIDMKEYYSLLQVRHWLLANRLQSECGRNNTLILYFYSNEKGECQECDEQGFILTWLRKNYPDVQIFSFDTNLELNTLETIKRRYTVDQVPFLIIDEVSYPGFQSKNALLFSLVSRYGMNETLIAEMASAS